MLTLLIWHLKVAAMTELIVVNDDTSREDLIAALGYLNDTAKNMRRKGYTGTASEAYIRQHQRIDALLTELMTHA